MIHRKGGGRLCRRAGPRQPGQIGDLVPPELEYDRANGRLNPLEVDGVDGTGSSDAHHAPAGRRSRHGEV